MTLQALYEGLQGSSSRKLQLRINDNRSTLLSVRWESNVAKVSLHRMFLEAPQNVMDALACYIHKGKNAPLPPAIKSYIELQTRSLDYTHELDKEQLVTSGTVYDLQSIYDGMNARYFENSVKLHITWYGSRGKRCRSQVNFGLYVDSLKLIKIHRLLDMWDIPKFVVEFVVYHEMLHNLCPPEPSLFGRTSIHTHDFRKREKEYECFHEAEKWIKENKFRFFK